MCTKTNRATKLMHAVTMTAMLLSAAAGVGTFTAVPAMAQVKSVSQVKTLLKAELPANALELSAAIKAAKVGETITVRGYIPAANAFEAARSTFTLLGDSPRPQTDKQPEPAPNPDPAPPEARASVQVVAANGKPLAASLQGQHGLKPNAEVFVTGKVQSVSDTDELVLTAESMHIPKAPLPRGFFLEQRPDNAVNVSEARKAGTLKVGDQVVLRGRIGGSKDPFVPERAIFTLMGHGLKACSENPDDACATPWDYCCETTRDILANSVTVQVADAKGQILRTHIKGRAGLKELSEIIVVGKVTAADAKAVVVNATGVYAQE